MCNYKIAVKQKQTFLVQLNVLLLPKEEAGAWLASYPDPFQAVQELREHYGVSQEIIAWQARNSSVELSVKARSTLRRFVSRPWRF